MTIDPVRYQDGPTAEVSMEIAAPPSAVWAVISDPGFPVEQSEELQEARWDPDGPEPGVGARILGRNRHDAIGEWTTTSYVVSWDENELFGWRVADLDAPAAEWWFHLSPTDSGTLLSQKVRLGPGPSGLSPAIEKMPDRELDIIKRRLEFHEAAMTANLDAVRARVEAV